MCERLSTLSSLVLVFPSADGVFDVLPLFWLPGQGLREREDTDRVPYWTWREQGYLETTPGPTVDYAYVVQRIGELASRYRIKTIAYDRWRIEDLRRALGDEGVTVELTEFGQGFQSMAPAIDEIERLMFEKRLRHGGHPILKWNAANAVAVGDPSGNRKLDKTRSRERIDGLVALVMALATAKRHEAEMLPLCLTDGPVVFEF